MLVIRLKYYLSYLPNYSVIKDFRLSLGGNLLSNNLTLSCQAVACISINLRQDFSDHKKKPWAPNVLLPMKQQLTDRVLDPCEVGGHVKTWQPDHLRYHQKLLQGWQRLGQVQIIHPYTARTQWTSTNSPTRSRFLWSSWYAPWSMGVLSSFVHWPS